jgi:hypothetical protein
MLTAELLTPVTHSHYERGPAGGPWDLSRCARRTGYVGRLLTLTIAVALLSVAPAGGGGMTPSAPDVRLVLSVVNPGSRHQEMVVVGDARGGPVHSRRLPGGTLCHGPLLTVGERVVYLASRGGELRPVSLGLDLRGRPRPFVRAEQFGAPDRRGVPAPDGHRLARPMSRGGHRLIALVDRSSGQQRVLPGTRLGLYQALAWSPSGRWVIYADERERLRAHRISDGIDIGLPLRPRGNVMSLAAVPPGR